MEQTEHLGWDDTHPDEWRAGRSCPDCDRHILEKRRGVDNADKLRVHFGLVPGGATGQTWRKDYEKQFNADMTAYSGARKAGLQPNQVSVKAVHEAEYRAEVTEKLGDRLGVDDG